METMRFFFFFAFSASAVSSSVEVGASDEDEAEEEEEEFEEVEEAVGEGGSSFLAAAGAVDACSLATTVIFTSFATAASSSSMAMFTDLRPGMAFLYMSMYAFELEPEEKLAPVE